MIKQIQLEKLHKSPCSVRLAGERIRLALGLSGQGVAWSPSLCTAQLAECLPYKRQSISQMLMNMSLGEVEVGRRFRDSSLRGNVSELREPLWNWSTV